MNDVTGLSDPHMAATVAERGSSLVVMHMPGDPRTMHLAASYADVVGEVRDHLVARASDAVAAGVDPDRVCIDPGIGFGKTSTTTWNCLPALENSHRVASRSWWERRVSRSSVAFSISLTRPSAIWPPR